MSTGRLRVLVRSARTPAGSGAGAGRPVRVEDDPVGTEHGEAVVLVAADPLGFRRTSRDVRRWLDAGADLRGLLLAGDEARLVAARVPDLGSRGVPVVDGVDVGAVLGCPRVAVEVAGPGAALRRLVDPVWLTGSLGLDGAEALAARDVAAELAGAGAAVVGLGDPSGRSAPEPLGDQPWVRLDEGRSDLLDVLPRLATAPVGHVTAWRLPPGPAEGVADLGAVDLDGGRLPSLRPDALARHRVGVAVLPPGDRARCWPEAFEGAGRRVHVVASEATAALAGARTTPGAPDDAVVLDLGGGTLDLVGAGEAVTAAGCGDLLTEVVAAVLDVSRGAAEWVKRAPSLRLESPHVGTDESGARHFLDGPAPAGAVGWLTVPGPGGRLPFSRDLVPAEWRLTRRALKQLVLGGSVARAVDSGPGDLGGTVLLAGGPAGDDEVVDLLREAWPRAVVGRADVAGVLGTRYAVAHGLVLAWCS